MDKKELDELEAWALHGKTHWGGAFGASVLPHTSPDHMTENEALRELDNQVVHAPRHGDQDDI